MEIFLQYVDDTKLDHFYTQVSRRSERRGYSLPENQPLRDLLPEMLNFTRAPHKATDACLQLHGPDAQRYLDMDCTLKEHLEDFGVRVTREATFLIKTKLSILISLLKDKMEMCSQGGDTRTLRTILKHMPDIIDEDSDFAPELLKQRGLSFLRSLTERDCYSNFDRRKVTTIVLNVLLKIVSYVDGMLAVYRDRSTVAWLYSQVKICSDARNPDGRNTAIAVLYIFVDSELDAEAGAGEPAPGPHDLAVLFVKCAQEMHLRAGTPPFSEFLDILSERTPADPETVLASVQLLNKTLETLKDADEMDYFDDLVSALLEQGLSKLIEKQKQGKSAKNKLMQEYNKFVDLLRQEYEEGTGDLDSILKSCMGRRPSFQPGGVSSGSEDNLLALDRKKRSSLTHSPLSSTDKSDQSRSLTPDVKLGTPLRSSYGEKLSPLDWKKKENFSYGQGLTSTPKPETDTSKESPVFSKSKRDRYSPSSDSYTPGTFRFLNSVSADSGYQSPAPKQDSSEKIFSPYDRHRKVYYAKNVASAGDTITPSKHPYSRVDTSVSTSQKLSEKPPVTSSLESKYSQKPVSTSRDNPVSTSRDYPVSTSRDNPVVSPLESRFAQKYNSTPKDDSTSSNLEPRYSQKPTNTPSSNYSSSEARYSQKSVSSSSEEAPPSPSSNSRLNVVKSHPYQKLDSLSSPDGPPKKLDSPFSSFSRKGRSLYDISRPVYGANYGESSVKTAESSVKTAENTVKTAENIVKTSEKSVNKLDTKSLPQTTDSKQDTKQESEVSSVGNRWSNKWKKVETTHSVSDKENSANANKSESNRSRDRLERRKLPDADQVIRAVQDTRSNSDTPHLPLTGVRSLKERRIALALNSTDSVSIDTPEAESTPVNVQVRSSAPEKVTPLAPGKLPTDSDGPSPPTPQQEPQQPRQEPRQQPQQPPTTRRIAAADPCCDLAPITSQVEVFIFPFSPDIKLEPSELRLPEVHTPPVPTDTGLIVKQKSQTLPTSKSTSSGASSGPSSPTEENQFSKQLAFQKRTSVAKLELIPLPEVNLARHDLTFGQIEFRLLDSKYDKDPYQAARTHVPGVIPPPPPDLPRVRTIPAPPPDLPEVGGGAQRAKKLGTIRFRWKLLGKESGQKKGDIWSELKRVVAPSDVINAYSNIPTAAPTPPKPSKQKETSVEVLQMKRRTSLGVTLKCLQKFKLREDDDNFRKLRGYLETMDLEVLNEEIIEVLEKDVITKGFSKELEDIRRAKQEALSQGSRIKLREEEKFLLALGEVEDLQERIGIATFCLRFHEKEEALAKRLMVLMGAAAEVRESHTFKFVLSTLLSIGNAVEQREAGGFDLEFLERAESYKDSCHKKDLIHHAAVYVMEHFPSSSNLFSDFHNVHEAWRMELDFVDLKTEITAEQEKWSQCKICLGRLKLPSHDSFNQKLEQFGLKINKFYITLGRMENYYRDLYLYLGYDRYLADSQKLFSFLKVLHNFALNYKSHYERIIQIREKMEQEKRRQKTRGKKLPIAENIQVKMVEPESEGARTESGAEDEGTGVANNVISAVIAQRSKESKKPKTGIRYREKKAHGNRREKRTSIRRTLNEEDGLIDIAKKELSSEQPDPDLATN